MHGFAEALGNLSRRSLEHIPVSDDGRGLACKTLIARTASSSCLVAHSTLEHETRVLARLAEKRGQLQHHVISANILVSAPSDSDPDGPVSRLMFEHHADVA